MLQQVIRNYLTSLRKILKTASPQKTDHIIKSLLDAKRVFVFGAGRSGLMAKAFTMRLMHLGKKVFFIGETITPSVQPGDVVFLISGSGETLSLVNILRVAQKNHIKVIGLTASRKGTLYKKGDAVVCFDTLNGKSEAEGDYLAMQIMGSNRPIAPLGTSFESAALVYLDALIVILMAHLNQSEDDLKSRHANIE